METEKENTAWLEKKAADLGFDLFGTADIRDMRGSFALRSETARVFDRAVSLGKKLLDDVLDDIRSEPTPLYLHHYRQLNFFLDRGAFLLASILRERGFRALPIPASQILDWEKQTAHLSHKHVALRAGLGWIGRSNLLVNPRLGSRFRLVTVLTDMPLEAGRPLARDCGSCRACIPVCPAGSIRESPADFDHHGCYGQLKDWRSRHVVSQFICGICVRACRGAAGEVRKETD